MSEHITSATAHDGAVAVLRFARPAKRNAITVAMYEALTAALHAAIADEAVRAVVLLGADGVFTAGNDLKDFMANPPPGRTAPCSGCCRLWSIARSPSWRVSMAPPWASARRRWTSWWPPTGRASRCPS